MFESVAFFVLKGIVVLIITYILIDFIRKINHSAKKKGVLEYNFTATTIALFNLAFAILLWYIFISKNYRYQESSQTIALLLLIIFFTASTIYLTLEIIFTKGSFDEETITFNTIWRGQKKQRWEDLIYIDSNDTLSWYILGFQDGTKIRLSYFLSGVGDLMDFLIDIDQER